MQNLNLTELYFHVIKDEKAKTELFRIIKFCIQKANTKRRVTPEIIIEMMGYNDSERDSQSRRIKSLEIIDNFIAKNSILSNDREKIESFKSLEEAIFNIYRDNPLYENIKNFFRAELNLTKTKEKRALKIRKRYLGKSPAQAEKGDIISALEQAPLGSTLMWEIIYDVLHFETKIGLLGEPLTTSALNKISSDLQASLSAERNVQPIGHLPSTSFAGHKIG